MKFNVTNENVERVGDIKRNEVSINVNDLDFILNILSTNLYSSPISSFIREIVTNAWDSHVEANTTEPIILELGKNTEENYFCKIQDFGVGISPERFDKIFRMVGSSTKRDTNNLMGGFGIGRFSALAASDSVYLTSHYNNIQYKYIMYKDGTKIFIDEVYQAPTNERNGFEVMIYLNDVFQLNTCRDAVSSQLTYFENLYIIDKLKPEFAEKFNNLKIKKYNNFYVNSYAGNSANLKILLGKVLYPLRLSNLDHNFIKDLAIYSIIIPFDIGELEITPNREELIYSKKTIETIEAKIIKVIAEIKNLIVTQKTVNCKTVTEYLEKINNKDKLVLLTAGDTVIYIPINNMSNLGHLTFQGIYYDTEQFKSIYSWILGYYGIRISHTLSYNKKILKADYTRSLTNVKNNMNSYIIAKVGDLNKITKEYIRDQISGNTYFIAPKSWKRYFKAYLEAYKRKVDGYSKSLKYNFAIFKILAEYIRINILQIKKLDNSDVPEWWLKERKKKLAEKRLNKVKNIVDWKAEVNLFELRQSEKTTFSITSDSRIYTLNKLYKSFKKLTIFSWKDDPDFRSLYYLLSPHVKMIEIAPTKMKLLNNIPNFIEFDKFLNVENRLIRNIGTAEYIYRKVPHVLKLAEVRNIEKFSPKIFKLVRKIKNFYDKYSIDEDIIFRNKAVKVKEKEFIDEIFNICEKYRYFNEDIKGDIDGNIKLLEAAKVILLFTDKCYNYSDKILSEERINILTDYVVARKLFRPDWKTVVKKNKETIYNIKEEENENN